MSWEKDFVTYVNTPESGTMSGGHVLVQSPDGVGAAELSVLLVHVVGAGARIITEPDAKVLDLERTLLVDDVQRHNLASRLLDLSQLLQEVPEPGLGNNLVGCEYSHPVQLGSWVAVRWQVTADDLVFLEATCRKHR